ncbi:hypothetical protein [Clostridium botulinum]|uniref:hypothetical protein n=1 Tax=Clostridium botulinum TaxID=1491 RepID=UPI001E62FF97|nr:hypothetical protein [Clostridium botulinum]MCD3254378.1 hypothetical protein [Clostridium botulinum C/D]MCD3279878.1 hypothetical protein [Clostridium botulinum C/D]MCD3339609.1 hypothetical protein [Clostridium botulinum C/D]MCD3357517.1 hypothetical protein [Clostridium botulinum C/D]
MSLLNNFLNTLRPPKIEGITCNKCNYEMKPDEVKFHFTTVDKKRKIKRKYFACPKCKEKYSVGYEDESIYLNFGRMNEIRKEIKKYEGKAQKGADVNDKINELIKQYELMYCENLAISSKYKQEFESQQA